MNSRRVVTKIPSRFSGANVIGEGTSAKALCAKDSWTDREVILKISKTAGQSQEFHNEVELLSKLTSPCFPDVLEYTPGNQKQSAIMVLEKMPGQTASDTIDCDPDKLVLKCCQLLLGLNELSDLGYCHGDISATNILLDDYQSSLIDLGFAREIGSQNGKRTGTPESMAPELLAEGVLCENSDLYSLGVVLYELMSGHSPFPEDPEQMLNAIIEGQQLEPERNGDHPLFSLVKQMLVTDPAKRPSCKMILNKLIPGMNSKNVAHLLPDDLSVFRTAEAERELDEHARENNSVVLYGPPGSGKGYAASRLAKLSLLYDNSLVKIDLRDTNICDWLALHFSNHRLIAEFPALKKIAKGGQKNFQMKAEELRQFLSLIDKSNSKKGVGVYLDLGNSELTAEAIDLCKMANMQHRTVVCNTNRIGESLKSFKYKEMVFELPDQDKFISAFKNPVPGFHLSVELATELDTLNNGVCTTALECLKRNLASEQIVVENGIWHCDSEDLLAVDSWTADQVNNRSAKQQNLLGQLAVWDQQAAYFLWKGMLEKHDMEDLATLKAEGLLRNQGNKVLGVHDSIIKLIDKKIIKNSHRDLIIWLNEIKSAPAELKLYHYSECDTDDVKNISGVELVLQCEHHSLAKQKFKIIPLLLEDVDPKLKSALISEYYNVSFDLGKLEEAKKSARQLLCLPDTSDDKSANAMIKLSHVFRRQNKMLAAVRVLRSAASRYTEPLNLVTLLAEECDTLLKCGKVKSCKARFKHALKTVSSTRGSSKKPQLDTLTTLGNVAFQIGDLTKAADFWEEVLSREDQDLGVHLKVWVTNNLGLIHLRANRLEMAREFLSNACRIAELNHLESAELIARVNLALVYSGRGDPERALREFEHCLVQAEQLGQRDYQIAILHNRGEAYSQMGFLDDAKNDWQKVLLLTDLWDIPAEGLDSLLELLSIRSDLGLSVDVGLERKLFKLSKITENDGMLAKWLLLKSWDCQSDSESALLVDSALNFLQDDSMLKEYSFARALQKWFMSGENSKDLMTCIRALPPDLSRDRYSLRFAIRLINDHPEESGSLIQEMSYTVMNKTLEMYQAYIKSINKDKSKDPLEAALECGRGVNILKSIVANLPEEFISELNDSIIIDTILNLAEKHCQEMDCVGFNA
jgi:serine/threonine protein kinase